MQNTDRKIKLDPSFITHEVDGVHYLISTDDTKFKGMVKNNRTAAFIIESLKKAVTEKEVADRLMDRYPDADRKVIEKDVSDMITKLRSIGAIAE